MLVFGEYVEPEPVEPANDTPHAWSRERFRIPRGEQYDGLRALWLEYVCGRHGSFTAHKARGAKR